MDNYERTLLQRAIEALHQLAGYSDSKQNYKPILHLVEGNKTVRSFRAGRIVKEPPAEERQEAIILEKSDVGTSDEEKGFVYFTDKEIKQMPEKFRKVILCNRKRCRMRVHVSGKNTTTYEIRYRLDGYNISACGKTIELAKANMIAKMQTAKPVKKNDDYNVPTKLQAFSEYFREKFRKRKLSEQTYYNNGNRLQNHVYPVMGDMEISKITPTVCQNLLDSLTSRGLGKSAVEIYSILNVILKGAIAHGIIQRNPLDIVVLEKYEQEHGRALTRAEEDALLKSVQGTPRGILYAICLYTGLRPNELVKPIRFEGRLMIAVNSKRKTKRVEYKRIYVCDKLAAILKDVDKIPTLHDKYLSTEFPKHCPGHRLYDLRVTFNTRCKELGVADHAREHFMGHSLGALGNAYTDLSDEYLLKEGKKLDLW